MSPRLDNKCGKHEQKSIYTPKLSSLYQFSQKLQLCNKFLLYLILSESNTNAENIGKFSFIPYSEAWLSLQIFMKFATAVQLFAKYIKFHQTLTNGLVADIR